MPGYTFHIGITGMDDVAEIFTKIKSMLILLTFD